MKAFDLEQSLQEVTGRYEREKQRRRALHNSLVVSILKGKTFYFDSIIPTASSPMKLIHVLLLDISLSTSICLRVVHFYVWYISTCGGLQ